ncbi:hypothetical protein [Streptomyces sp. NPDC055186]
MRWVRFALTSTAAASLCVSGVVFGGIAHAAESKCSATQSKEFDTPGFDTDVHLQVCILEDAAKPPSEDYRTYTAMVLGHFTDGGGGSTRKFDNLDLEIRLESIPNDYVDKKVVCDVTAEVNNKDSGALRCEASLKMHVNMRPHVTGDATVHYDIDADGKGALGPWELRGSPHLS